MSHIFFSKGNLRNLGTVVIVSPGGLEHGGGIGRQMGYFMQAHERREDGLAYRVIDSRGPWFLGGSPFYSIFFASIFFGLAALKLLFISLTRRPILLHVNITGRGSTVRKIILMMVARCIRIPYLLHVHDHNYGEYYAQNGDITKAMIKSMFRMAMKVLVLGTRDYLTMSELLDLNSSRIAVLQNAVPDPQPDHARLLGSEAMCHLLFLGHLSARKGVPELLQALARPALASRPWRATLAGGGPIDEFRTIAKNLGIAERVHFPGWLGENQVRVQCSEADVLVLPSHGEGLAMSVLEGLSHGLAVVTTPVGAHPEVIEPEISGILVGVGDVDGLANALTRLVDDERLRNRLRAGARRRFLEKFDVRTYAESLSQLHSSLLREVGGVAIGSQQPR